MVIASPDKDFKQLISDNVQMVMPLPELQRWSFYTMRHYRDQYNCDPQSDLSLSEYIIYYTIAIFMFDCSINLYLCQHKYPLTL